MNTGGEGFETPSCDGSSKNFYIQEPKMKKGGKNPF
jgi:hypothetical protein